MRVLVSLILLALSPGTTAAQILVIEKVNHNAKSGDTPVTAKPEGIVSLTADQKKQQRRVLVDYGTFADGKFKLWDEVKEVAIEFTPAAEGNDSWAQPKETRLPDPPAGLHVRARLQVQDESNKDKPKWMTREKATTYKMCP